MRAIPRVSLMSLFSSRLFWKFFVAILCAQLAATLAIGAAIWWKNQTQVTPTSSLLENGPRARDNLAAAAATLQFAGEPALLQWLAQLQLPELLVLKGSETQLQQLTEYRDIRGQSVSAALVREAIQQAAQAQGKGAARWFKLADQSYLLFAIRQNRLANPAWHEFDRIMPHWPERPKPGLAERGTMPAPPDFAVAKPAPAPPPHDGLDKFSAAQNRTLAAGSGMRAPPAKPGKFERNPPAPRAPLTPWVMLIAAISVSLAFAAFLAWLFTRPLHAMEQAFNRAAQGDLSPQFAQARYLIDDELHQLGRDFDQMTARLRAVLEQQTRLMHDVSHELRSPLARIQAALGLIQQQPERTLTYVDRLERESARMDHLIGEILTLARLEAGAPQAPLEQLAISEVIASLLDDMQFEAQQQAQSLNYQLQQDFLVQAPLELLVRAIENIIRNAIKYSPAGSQIELQLGFDASQQIGWIRVLDQGPGVPESELEAIFQAFYRSQQTPASTTGHGLGLAMTRQIIQHLQGQVRASNLQPSGLCLSICLPATALPAVGVD